jgi:hypothetical protein
MGKGQLRPNFIFVIPWRPYGIPTSSAMPYLMLLTLYNS